MKTEKIVVMTISIHCVWLDEEEIDILAERGVKVSHTPEGNMKLAAGIAPVPEMLRKGSEQTAPYPNV